MKKLLFLSILFTGFSFFSQALLSQDVKPPKLRAYSGFLTVRYELGDKTIKEKEVVTHLQQYDAEAYHMMKSAKNLSTSSSLLTLTGAVCTLIAVSQKEPNAGLAVAGIAASVTGLVLTISSYSKKDKALEHYNQKYGY